ncbi:hypothetical protein APHAL10511_008154 [Amanita phalloides]|nr:hypothetical protein APHAL10511_008154 [Amanita phalloides]
MSPLTATSRLIHVAQVAGGKENPDFGTLAKNTVDAFKSLDTTGKYIDTGGGGKIILAYFLKPDGALIGLDFGKTERGFATDEVHRKIIPRTKRVGQG